MASLAASVLGRAAALSMRARAASGAPMAAAVASMPRRGLEEFMDPTRAPHEPVQAVGRAWAADELRRKSFEDLHKLWYVLYKERNVLLTEEYACKAQRTELKSPQRKTMVRKSMARIKLVLKEREIAAQQRAAALMAEAGGGGEVQQQEQQA